MFYFQIYIFERFKEEVNVGKRWLRNCFGLHGVKLPLQYGDFVQVFSLRGIPIWPAIKSTSNSRDFFLRGKSIFIQKTWTYLSWHTPISSVGPHLFWSPVNLMFELMFKILRKQTPERSPNKQATVVTKPYSMSLACCHMMIMYFECF